MDTEGEKKETITLSSGSIIILLKMIKMITVTPDQLKELPPEAQMPGMMFSLMGNILQREIKEQLPHLFEKEEQPQAVPAGES